MYYTYKLNTCVYIILHNNFACVCRKIRTNIYYDVKPTTLYEAQACECKPESGCGDDCINRMVFSECSPQLCPCGEKCENQKIQKHEWSPGLQRFMTEDKGWGVRTQQAIKSGDFILEYVGEVVSEREFKSRMATRYDSICVYKSNIGKYY